MNKIKIVYAKSEERDYRAEDLEVGTILEDYMGLQVKVIQDQVGKNVFLRGAGYGDQGLRIHNNDWFVNSKIVEGPDNTETQPQHLREIPRGCVFRWRGRLYLRVADAGLVKAVSLDGEGYLGNQETAWLPSGRIRHSRGPGVIPAHWKKRVNQAARVVSEAADLLVQVRNKPGVVE